MSGTFRSINTIVLTAVVMKNSVCWDIKPYSSLEISRRFGGLCHLRLQVIRIRQVATRLGLFFTLKMQANRTSVDFQLPTRRYITEYRFLQILCSLP
jgi:hypothetical protein